MARGFLKLVAGLALLVIVGAIAWRLFAPALIRTAFVPGKGASVAAAPPPDYAQLSSWIAHPGLADDPARWAPSEFRAAPKPAVAAFYIAPTAFLSRAAWNAPLDDPETNDRLATFTRMQASVLNGVATVWAPRYRQMTFGGFLKPGPEADRALAVAFGDIERAFGAFLAAQPADVPIILAGHSQGARHLLHLLERMDPAVKARVVVAYAVGWPVAVPQDLTRLQLAACTPGAGNCLASWQSWAADGDLAEALAGFEAARDVSGAPLGRRPMLCTNPLTGGGGAAPPDRNAGTLIDEALQPRRAGARCDPRGLLLVEPAPRDIGPFVLPGGNFHVYDYSLFWANVRADVEARLSAFGAARAGVAAPDAESV
jgi:hypothetical protein